MKKLLMVLVSIVFIVSGCSDKHEEVPTSGTIGSTLSYEDFSIKLNDVYYGDFSQNGVDIAFDNYLATDLVVENISDDQQMFKALRSFTVTDDDQNVSKVMIDENRKQYSKGLLAGDEFAITLVFPVNNSNLYELHYSPGKTVSKNNVLSWQFSAPNPQTKKVEPTIEHRNEEDVASEFLLNDGSKNIEFTGNETKEQNEQDS